MRIVCLILVGFALTGCDDDNDDEQFDCTEIGCDDGLSLSLSTHDDVRVAGQYVLELDFDDKSYVCTIDIPITCEPAMDGFVSANYDSAPKECSEEIDDENVSDFCAPWPINIFKRGTPGTLDVRVICDGVQIFESSQEPVYHEERPNGPHCGPVCKTTRVELTMD